jgi:TPR repeat protein
MWFRKAAGQGDAKAKVSLGVMYVKGLGVPKNDAEALNWFREAAEQGDVKGQFNLGVMYDTGRGAPKDKAEAAKWYRKAAEQGHAKARDALANLRQAEEERARYEATRPMSKGGGSGEAPVSNASYTARLANHYDPRCRVLGSTIQAYGEDHPTGQRQLQKAASMGCFR